MMFFDFLGWATIFSGVFLVYLSLITLVAAFASWDLKVCLDGVKSGWPFALRLSVGFGLLMSMGKTFIDIWYMV